MMSEYDCLNKKRYVTAYAMLSSASRGKNKLSRAA